MHTTVQNLEAKRKKVFKKICLFSLPIFLEAAALFWASQPENKSLLMVVGVGGGTVIVAFVFLGVRTSSQFITEAKNILYAPLVREILPESHFLAHNDNATSDDFLASRFVTTRKFAVSSYQEDSVIEYGNKKICDARATTGGGRHRAVIYDGVFCVVKKPLPLRGQLNFTWDKRSRHFWGPFINVVAREPTSSSGEWFMTDDFGPESSLENLKALGAEVASNLRGKKFFMAFNQNGFYFGYPEVREFLDIKISKRLDWGKLATTGRDRIQFVVQQLAWIEERLDFGADHSA